MHRLGVIGRWRLLRIGGRRWNDRAEAERSLRQHQRPADDGRQHLHRRAGRCLAGGLAGVVGRGWINQSGARTGRLHELGGAPRLPAVKSGRGLKLPGGSRCKERIAGRGHGRPRHDRPRSPVVEEEIVSAAAENPGIGKVFEHGPARGVVVNGHRGIGAGAGPRQRELDQIAGSAIGPAENNARGRIVGATDVHHRPIKRRARRRRHRIRLGSRHRNGGPRRGRDLPARREFVLEIIS